MNETSCVGCKFLCRQDHGYSNYTVEEVEIFCAKNLNHNLPDMEPYNWITQGVDMWPKTNESRCDSYSAGEGADFDVDGEVKDEAYIGDAELYAALKEYRK